MRATDNLFALALSLLLAGCLSAATEQRALEAVASSYVAIEIAADAARVAHERGVIDDNQRAEAKQALQIAIAQTQSAERLIAIARWADAIAIAERAASDATASMRALPEAAQ